jgi:hypothetical protein
MPVLKQSSPDEVPIAPIDFPLKNVPSSSRRYAAGCFVTLISKKKG